LEPIEDHMTLKFKNDPRKSPDKDGHIFFKFLAVVIFLFGFLFTIVYLTS